MRNVLFYIFLVILLGKPGDVFSRWVSPFNTAPVPIKVHSSVNKSFSLNTNGFDVQSINVDDENWTQLSIPGTVESSVQYAPQLPVIVQLLQVPFEGNVELIINNITNNDYNLKQRGFKQPVKPAPEYQMIDNHYQPLIKKGEQYIQNSFYPANPVKINGYAKIRGKRFARIEIYPLQYNPVSADVRMNSEIEFRVQHGPVSAPRSALNSLEFEKILQNDLEQNETENSGSLPEFLIITPASFVDVLQPFVQWKIQKGYYVTIATLDETGTDPESIRQYIRNAYMNGDHPPLYVLLAGGSKIIMPFTGKYSLNPNLSHVTDLYYAEMDGGDDVFPDLFVGRFPASDAAQLAIMIEKSLSFEKIQSTDRVWLENATFVATKDEYFHEFVQNGHQKTISTYFAPQNINCDTLWTYANPDKSQLSDAVKRGTSFIVYSGHGAKNYWNDLGSVYEPFSLVDIYYLNNIDQYPIVLSFGCDAGDFSQDDCLGESWLKYENTGAAFFWGATDLSMWYRDYYLQDRFFNSVSSGKYGTIAESVTKALFNVFLRGYSYYEMYHEIYNMLGDPSLPVWMGPPDELHVTAPDTLYANMNNLTLSVSSTNGDERGALAALSANNELLAVTHVDQQNATLNFDDITRFNELYLTVSYPGHETWQKKMIIDSDIVVEFTPSLLKAAVAENVQVHVEKAGTGPLSGFELEMIGYGLPAPVFCVTDNDGNSVFNITSLYGQELDVTGRINGGTFQSYKGNLVVQAGDDFITSTINVSQSGVFVEKDLIPNYLTDISVETSPAADSVYVKGCGFDTVFVENTFSVIPKTAGVLTVTASKPGFNIIDKSKNLVPHYVDVTGSVKDQDQSGIPFPDIHFEQIWGDSKLDTTGNSNGEFSIQNLPAGKYKLEISANGFTADIDTITVDDNHIEFNRMLAMNSAIEIQGTINDQNGAAVPDAQIIITSQGINQITNADGKYYIDSIIPGEIDFFVNAKGYRYLDTLIAVPGKGPFILDIYLIPGNDEIFLDFESENGLFTTDGLWQWGKPGPGLNFRGPESSYSGENCWGTVLDGDYTALSNNRLTSVPVDLDGFKEPFLEIQHYYQMDYMNIGFDGGNVKLSDDGGSTWQVLQPVAGYPSDTLEALPGGPGFSGAIDNWQPEAFDLGEFVDKTVMIQFHFASTAQVNDVGWYIDDFHLFDKATSLANGFHDHQLSFNLGPNYPNPFNAGTMVEYSIPQKGFLNISVYNVLGQQIRTLVNSTKTAGEYRTFWDGKTKTGYDAGAGMYFIRLTSGQYSSMIKVLLLR